MDQKRQISTSDLKSKCSSVIEQVSRSRESVIITRRGRPVAELRPIDERPSSLFGFAKGSLNVRGNIVDPLDLSWEASE